MNSWSIVPNFSTTFQDTFPTFCSDPTYFPLFTGHEEVLTFLHIPPRRGRAILPSVVIVRTLKTQKDPYPMCRSQLVNLPAPPPVPPSRLSCLCAASSSAIQLHTDPSSSNLQGRRLFGNHKDGSNVPFKVRSH